VGIRPEYRAAYNNGLRPLHLALILLATLAAFGASLAGPFHFDDFSLFADSPGRLPAACWDVFRLTQTRPLTYLTLWLNHAAGGTSPAGYHAVNVALHLAAALLLYTVVQRRFDAQLALAAALIFAVHPVQAEPVNYVFARSITLAAVGCLASWHCWQRRRTVWAVLCFALALAAKEECVAFPLALAALERTRGASWRELRPILVMLGLSLAAGLRVLWATSVIAGTNTGFGAAVSPLEYLSYQGYVAWRYARLLVLPWGFSVDPQIDPGVALRALSWLGWAGAAWALWRWRTAPATPWIAAGLLLLLPSTSVLPAQDLAADRRLYLPMLAFAIAAALALPRKILAPVVVAWIALSAHRTYVWNSEVRLWREAVEAAPGKARPRLQLSRAVDDPQESLRLLNEAARLDPGDVSIPLERGRRFLTAQQPAQALAEFGRALALRPDDARALNNRGVALAQLGQTDAAVADFRRALQQSPCLYDAHRNLAQLGQASDWSACSFPEAWAGALRR
jgi:hypothetical protein